MKKIKMYRITWNKINWTEEMISFLKNNYTSMTNKKLADSLGLRLTTTRTKLYELGYKRMDLEYWTNKQIQFLKDRYQTIGDVILAEMFNKKFPKKKLWTKKHIEKKRKYLSLIRTPEEIYAIRNEHSKPGGRCNTILKYSASIFLTDRYIANSISWRNKGLTDELMMHPEIIELKRAQLKLRRRIRDDWKKSA
jgi:hypothetical protein